MKIVVLILIAIVVLLLLFGGYQLFNNSTPNFAPKRPSNLSSEAVWSGGRDGGAWFVVNPRQPAPDVWEIKIYNDDGHPWARGSFWLKDAPNVKPPFHFSAFDGRIIYLEGNKMMFAIGEHFYPHGDSTRVITYPAPGPDYDETKPIGEREDKPESW